LAELACLTGRSGGAAETLPAVELLAHSISDLPLHADSVAAVTDYELLLVDATRDLAAAQGVCRALRAADHEAAILVVMPEAGLAGLQPDWGASDFVLATAGPAEVETRIRLLAHRRPVVERDAPIQIGDLVVDPVSYQVRLRRRVLDLTFKEFELLRFLAGRPGRVSTREQLLSEVWGYDFFGGTRTVDVHVRRLRAKLGPEYDAMIATVRGVGYKLIPADQARAEREATRPRDGAREEPDGAGDGEPAEPAPQAGAVTGGGQERDVPQTSFDTLRAPVAPSPSSHSEGR
jgi:DNA-binding response OmpR family regulator